MTIGMLGGKIGPMVDEGLISRMTPLEARNQLTLMGLQYFSQEQFVAAIERGDKLAVELFIAGGCVSVGA